MVVTIPVIYAHLWSYLSHVSIKSAFSTYVRSITHDRWSLIDLNTLIARAGGKVDQALMAAGAQTKSGGYFFHFVSLPNNNENELNIFRLTDEKWGRSDFTVWSLFINHIYEPMVGYLTKVSSWDVPARYMIWVISVLTLVMCFKATCIFPHGRTAMIYGMQRLPETSVRPCLIEWRESSEHARRLPVVSSGWAASIILTSD